jgi:hypothetical protein
MKRIVSAFGWSSNRNIALTIIVALVMITAVVELTSATAGVQFDWNNPDRTPGFVHQQGRDEVRIELTTNGFAPSEVQHAPGTFAIAIENNALSGEYRLKLKADDGTVLNEFHVQKGSSAWTVSLQTGRYTLTEASHPQWICSLVIQ